MSTVPRRCRPLIVTAVLALLPGCLAEVGGEDVDGGLEEAEGEYYAPFSIGNIDGPRLQDRVLRRARGIAAQNRPYKFNGVQDCYGYVRQVWNAILHDGKVHSEDFYPKKYNRSRWLGVGGGLPVADAPSSKWAWISRPGILLPGDALATAKGHAWGAHWHGGIYAGLVDGKHMQWDNTVTWGKNGAYRRPLWSGFHYYYKPTHNKLARAAAKGRSVTTKLVATHSGKCLEVKHGGTANSVNVWQFGCNGSAAQKWIVKSTGDGYYTLTSKVSGKCLDVSGNRKTNGANVIQYTCKGSNNQKWKLTAAGGGGYGRFMVRARSSGKCLDVSGSKKANGTNVQQWSCHGRANQRWKLSLP